MKSAEITVDCTTIDFMVFESKMPHPDIIKIDVEGAEYIVLQGMQRVINEYYPDIIIDGMTKECFSKLKSSGYNIYDLLNMRSITDINDISFTVLVSKKSMFTE